MEAEKGKFSDMDAGISENNPKECMTEGLSEHWNEGYLVRVHFNEGGCSATDAVKHYLDQVIQLKY